MQLENGNDYINMVPVFVTYSNDIELNSDMVITPGNTLTKGEEISVNLNIMNNGALTFTGQYGLALYDLNGDLAQELAYIDETDGLPAGYTYLDPYLTFSSPVDVEPGSYLLALLHKSTDGEWQLTGSTNFQNPVRIIVRAAALLPDIYEENNTVGNSWDIPVNFVNNQVHVMTSGSNCHEGNDYDYYKIDLPAGYNYTISPRLQDSYSSDDGNTYTLDALFTLSPDGEQWTDTYDDIMNGDVTLENGGPVYFLVSPYFTGETGTYLLDMTISRSPASALTDNDVSNLIHIYPNPAIDHVWIDLTGFNGQVNKIEVINGKGQHVLEPLINPVEKSFNMDLKNLPGGIYLIRLNTDKGILSKKIIIKD
jgi:hypothetical protein